MSTRPDSSDGWTLIGDIGVLQFGLVAYGLRDLIPVPICGAGDTVPLSPIFLRPQKAAPPGRLSQAKKYPKDELISSGFPFVLI